MDEPWVVYIIRAQDGRLYTGIAKDPAKRFEQHRAGRGAKFFRGNPPVEIVYRESVVGLAAALKRERAIKRQSRQAKLRLVAAYRPHLE